MTDVAPALDELDDAQAVRVLRLVLEHERLLPDADRGETLDAQVKEAAQQPLDGDDPAALTLAPQEGPVSEGALARDALGYLLTERPQLAPVVARAVEMTRDPFTEQTRELVTLGVGALVVLALQTDVQIERSSTGKWRFKVHKKAMSDNAIVKVLGKLTSLYSGGPTG